MNEKVLDNDNGIIAIALQVYADFIKNTSSNYAGNSQLIDRVNELSVIFRDKDPKQRYELGVEE